MARTATEKRILQQRRAKGILVPLLEELLEHEVRVEDDDDEQFMLHLMRSRKAEREKGVFSPSMLASCLRQSYFAKTGVEKRPAPSPQTNGYFLNGDWLHFKWQFCLWKLHRAGKIELLGVEVRVYHPNGDFAGTVDAIVRIDGKVYIVDFKGINVNAFQKQEKFGADKKYKTQIVGYAMIVNLGKIFEAHSKLELKPVKVDACLIIAENKGGPTTKGSPIALHEDLIAISSYKSEVKRLMKKLRGYVEREEIPPPACTSTRTKQFQECPFYYRCKVEVKAIQAEKEGRKKTTELRPSPTSRRANSRDRADALSGSVED